MAKPDIPCVPNPDCKYFNQGCYEDTHHLHKQSEADTPLKRRFCRMAENVIEICREKHEIWEYEVGWIPYPSVEEMRARLDDTED